MTVIRNKSLSIINKDYSGNRIIEGVFLDGSPSKSLLEVLKWQLAANPQKAEKKADAFQLQVQIDISLDKSKDQIIWLGHASFVIILNGKALLFDPCYFDLPFIKRHVKVPEELQAIKIDYLLYSHTHRDHLDFKSFNKIQKANKGNFTILLPLKVGAHFRKESVNNIIEAGWYQDFGLDEDFQVFFLPALHWNRRGLTDFNKELWGSFWIKFGDFNIFYAGDTAYGQHFKEIKDCLGSPDIAILPIGAYKPAFMMEMAHMNPVEASYAAADLEAKTVIPMHYGTYDLSDEPMGEPIRLLSSLKKTDLLDATLSIPKVGESIFLNFQF